MRGKVVVITGPTSGIGQVAAERLAEMGARLVLVARDRAHGESTLARLRARAPGVAHAVHRADLSRLAEAKRVAAEIAAAAERVDVLVNNAGALFGSRRVTEVSMPTPRAICASSTVARTAAPRRVRSTMHNAARFVKQCASGPRRTQARPGIAA